MGRKNGSPAKRNSPVRSPQRTSPPRRAASPPRVSLADKYAPVSSTPLYDSLQTPVRPVPPAGYRNSMVKGPSPAMAARHAIQGTNVTVASSVTQPTYGEEESQSCEQPILQGQLIAPKAQEIRVAKKAVRPEPKVVTKARIGKKIGTSVLQVKICERTNPSRDVESDILIEAFEPIASQRFVLITSIDEVAAAAGCQVEELQNNDKSGNVLWQHSIQGLNFV